MLKMEILCQFKLQEDELHWKLSLDYDVESDLFVLYIHGFPFLMLLYQAVVFPFGP